MIGFSSKGEQPHLKELWLTFRIRLHSEPYYQKHPSQLQSTLNEYPQTSNEFQLQLMQSIILKR